MTANVLLLGCGDAGLLIADGLLRQGGVGRLVLADFNAGRVGRSVAMLACCHDAAVAFEEVDGRDRAALATLIRKVRPDLVIQAASLVSPWSIIGRDHPVAGAIGAAGIGIQLPGQLPVVLNLMQVIRDLGRNIPVANLSMPDIIHPILATRGLAPTIGLGNVSIQHLRVLAALKARREASPAGRAPLVRLIGHHQQVYGVMQATPPDDPANRVRVYLGEAGERDDGLAYEGTPFPPGPVYNVITAAAALPVLGALLPEAVPRRFSAPGPLGLPGGYPVTIDQGEVALDLPAGVDPDEAVAFNHRIGRLDGVAEIGPDGAVRFTGAAEAAVRDVDPCLAEPLDPWNLADRTGRLLQIIRDMGPV